MSENVVRTILKKGFAISIVTLSMKAARMENRVNMTKKLLSAIPFITVNLKDPFNCQVYNCLDEKSF